MAFKLPAALAKRIDELATELHDACSDWRDEWNDRSESWQDGDAGQAVDTWLEGLENLADELESVDVKPDA